MMDEFASESDSDYTSYWRDWVSPIPLPSTPMALPVCVFHPKAGIMDGTNPVSWFCVLRAVVLRWKRYTNKDVLTCMVVVISSSSHLGATNISAKSTRTT